MVERVHFRQLAHRSSEQRDSLWDASELSYSTNISTDRSRTHSTLTNVVTASGHHHHHELSHLAIERNEVNSPNTPVLTLRNPGDNSMRHKAMQKACWS